MKTITEMKSEELIERHAGSLQAIEYECYSIDDVVDIDNIEMELKDRGFAPEKIIKWHKPDEDDGYSEHEMDEAAKGTFPCTEDCPNCEDDDSEEEIVKMKPACYHRGADCPMWKLYEKRKDAK